MLHKCKTYEGLNSLGFVIVDKFSKKKDQQAYCNNVNNFLLDIGAKMINIKLNINIDFLLSPIGFVSLTIICYFDLVMWYY